MGRSRYSGEVETLGQVLLKHIKTPTSLGKYDEDPKVVVGKLNSAAIVSQAALFRDLRKLQPNLSFTKSVVEATLKLHAKSFDLGDHIDDWVNTISARLRKMCRHIAHTEVHSPRAPWLRHLWELSPLPGKPAADVEVAESSRAGAAASACKEYFVGWGSFQKKAWRQEAAGSVQKEYAETLDVNLGLPEDEPITAVFPDGHRAMIAEYTIGDHKEELQAKGKSFGAVWAARMEDGTKLKVVHTSQRGRSPLTILFCRGKGSKQKQLVGVNTNLFADAEACGQFMVDIAQQYYSQQISAEELSNYRDQMLKDLNIATPKKGFQKNPLQPAPIKSLQRRPASKGDEDATPTKKKPPKSEPCPCRSEALALPCFLDPIGPDMFDDV